MNEKLTIWANKVIDIITPYAENIDRDFYPLQSPIKTHIDVLFIGLNPGGGATYSSQKNNSSWKFENGRMTANKLLQGNPQFKDALNEWSLLKGLKQIDYFNQILHADNYLLTNYYYISTSDFDVVKKDPAQKDALIKCKELTLELINLIKPKTIIVLGTSNGIDKLPFTNKKTILNGSYKRLLVSAEFEGIRVFAIPHPSTLAISQEEVSALNTNLIELIKGKVPSNFHFEKTLMEPFVLGEFNNEISRRNSNISFVPNNKNNEFQTVLRIGNDKLLMKIVIKPKEKYLGIRDANAGNIGSSDRFYNNLENSELYCSRINNYTSKKKNGWLIKKDFKQYEVNSTKDLYKAISDELFGILNK